MHCDGAELLGMADEEADRGDVEGEIVHLAAAIRAFTDAGDRRAAAVACARLGNLYHDAFANKAAARSWYARAERLLADEEPCVEQGWVAIAPMGCDVDDPALLEQRTDLALDRARRFGDLDLEIKALADGGLARVQAGRVADGMAMIDEAMALACGGGATDLGVVGKAVCTFYTACYHTGDLERVESWTPEFVRLGIVGAAPGRQAFLTSHCESVRGTLLCHLGRWGEAEHVLQRAWDELERVMPGAAWHPPIALAELRILQGRLDEAEALLVGRDHAVQALLPTARLHLARGEYDLARATARRGLRMVRDDRVRGAHLLAVLAQTELRRGNLAEAEDASSELDRRTEAIAVPALVAEASRVRALVRAAASDNDAAVDALLDGLDAVAGRNLPLAELALHLGLARVHDGRGDAAEARVAARTASALLSRLDVVLAPDDAALLARLGGSRSSAPVACRVATLAFADGWWTAACGDTRVRLRDTKGLRYVAALVARPSVERHALDLVDLVEGVATDGVDRRRLGDAGPLLDARARVAYRRRVVELRDEVEDALAVEDDERAARAQAELDDVLAELARSLGLGGRDRQASSPAEKARLNVTRAVRAAVAKLAEALPDAGAVLDRRIRTGSFCAYEPHPDDPVLWSVQS